MEFIKHFLILFALIVLTFFNNSFARVSIDDATKLFYSIDSILKNHSNDARKIDFKLTINKRILTPGAFSKWEKIKKVAEITVRQSLLELEHMDERVLAAFLCHEFGHFLGGKPYVKDIKRDDTIHSFRNIYKNMSAEGQADYFATKTCLPQVFTSIMWKDQSFDHSSLIQCALSRSVPYEVCYALTNTVKKTTDFYQYIEKVYFRIEEEYSPLERSKAQVMETIRGPGKYPSLQCRFDTMMAGLNTAVDYVMERPACWYNSSEEED